MAVMDKVSDIKTAVIGLGGIGRCMTRAAADVEGMQVTAACDIVPGKRESFAEEHPDVPVYASVDDLMANGDFDAALVVTSDSCHREPFVKCLDSGKHVFVEKPVGNTVEEIVDMIDAMDRHPDLVAASGHILRYYPENRRIKEMALNGEFGEIFYMEGDYIHNLQCQAHFSRYNEAMDRNWYLEDEKPMVGGGCHPFDVLRWIVDSPVSSVSAMSNNIAFPEMRQHDCIVATYRFETGAVAKVTALYAPVCPRPPFLNIAVYGTKATVLRGQVCRNHKGTFEPLDYEPYEEKFGHGFERELADLVGAVREGREVLAPARDCALSEIATLVATDAATAGKELQVPRF